MSVGYEKVSEPLPNGKRLQVLVDYDESPMNPLEDEDVVHVVCLNHRRYALGHEQVDGDAMEELRQRLLGGEMAAYRPVYMYDHSGVALSTEPFGCRWDSGLIGWAYITKEVAAETGHNYETVEGKRALNRSIESVVKEYGHYASGDTWYIRVCDEEGENLEVSSFIGDLDDAREEAKGLLEWVFGTEARRLSNNRKYQLVPEDGMYRLYALEGIPQAGVKIGDKGGLIAQDGQLSHDGACWVAEGASIRDDVHVFGDALIEHGANLRYDAEIGGNAIVTDRSEVFTLTLEGITRAKITTYFGPDKEPLVTISGDVSPLTEAIAATQGSMKKMLEALSIEMEKMK